MTPNGPVSSPDLIDHMAMVAELDRDEGVFCKVYDDATGIEIRPGNTVQGHPTIGVGRALDTKGLSLSECRMLLDNDIAEYLADLAALPWFMALDPLRRRAIVNMRHQLGLKGLLAFSTMIAAIGRRDYIGAAKAGLQSRWASETPLRARRVMDMLRTGLPYQAGPSPAPTA